MNGFVFAEDRRFGWGLFRPENAAALMKNQRRFIFETVPPDFSFDLFVSHDIFMTIGRLLDLNGQPVPSSKI